MTPDTSEWRRLLDTIDGQRTAGEVARALADARELSDDRAFDLVEDALEGDDAPLVERSHSTCTAHDPEADPEDVAEYPGCRAHREGTTTTECNHDARYKWGHAGHYRDREAVAIAEADPRLDGRAFIQQEDDPFLFVDGDDIRCPETGGVHPAFIAILERFGLTYADISDSDGGSHPTYEGELPNGQSQAVFQIDDEPWGRTTRRRRSRSTPGNTCASRPASMSAGSPSGDSPGVRS